MAAIVKANANLLAGGISVIQRNFAASDSGQMNYQVTYCCLQEYATRWTPVFKTGAQPPTALPSNMLQLQLTKTPTLVDLNTYTKNGLTYFEANYSAGVETDVTITESSDVRQYSYSVALPIEYCYKTNSFGGPYGDAFGGKTVCTQTGTETVQCYFDYVSTTRTASSKNANVPAVRGSVSNPIAGYIVGINPARVSYIEQASKTSNSRGEYTYSRSSTGIYK